MTRAVVAVDVQHGIDSKLGARRLETTTWDDGTVSVDGSWTPDTIDCTEGQWAVQVARDDAALAGWLADVEANAARWYAAHPERADALADLVGDWPAPPKV